jgi:ATP-dependent exoDNAse (exonuclease V) beta subunit
MGLAALSDRLSRLPVGVALDLVLDAAGLRHWAARQRDAAQARADLLRLEAEASDFETAHRDLKAASGFHGETAKVFLGWLDARSGDRDFDRRPDPSADSAEAVEIVTWHASKGREWPITVVAEFDHGIEEWPGTTATRFDALDRVDDMAAVLASAALIHTPGFAAPEAARRFIEDRRADFEANARNLLYVALSRARDRLVLEWPGFLKEREDDAPEATCLLHVLQDACASQVGDGVLRMGGEACPAVTTHMPNEAGATLYAPGSVGTVPGFGRATPMPPVALTPWRLQPSRVKTEVSVPECRGVLLGNPWTTQASDAVRGTALHLAMRTFLTRPDLAGALPAATGLDEATLAALADRAAALAAWLSGQGYSDLRCEIPVVGQSTEGADIQGTVDLLAISPEGALIIDHKTGGPGAGFGPYWPQMSLYTRLVAELFPQWPVHGAAIFWIDHGRLDLASVGAVTGRREDA